MVKIVPTEVLVGLLAGSFLSIVAAMLVAWGWLLSRLLHQQPIFSDPPLVPRTEPPWGGRSVLLAVAVYFLVSLLVVEGYALASGRVLVPRHAKPAANEPPGPAALAQPEPPKLAVTEIMFVTAATNLVLLVVFPVILRRTSGARLRDLGISGAHWWRQAGAGVVGMLVTTPVVWFVQLASVKIWRPQGHPLEQMLEEQFTFDVGYLAFITAVVMAPLLEEMVFRGIIQRWLIKAFARRARAAKRPI